jgi:hypothetical protein
MPRVRRDQHYNQLNPFERGRIAEMHGPDYPFAKLLEDWVEVTLQSFEHGGAWYRRFRKT